MKISKCKYCDETWHQSFQCAFRPSRGSKPCKHCESTEHLSWQCFKNPNRKQQLKTKVKNGKHFYKWIKFRKQWFKDNPADHYTCYICDKWLTPAETTLDHIVPRSRAPHLRYEFSNLQPCCSRCNTIKGSNTIDKINISEHTEEVI